MSVDTNLKGRSLDSYAIVETGADVTILINPSLLGVADSLQLGVQKKLIGSKLIGIARHEHGPACSH